MYKIYRSQKIIHLFSIFLILFSFVSISSLTFAQLSEHLESEKNIINWNPGLYFGFKPTQFQNEDGSWKSAASVLSSNAMCKPGGENIKGIRIKLGWGDFEKSNGDYHGFELVDDVLNYLRSGGCGGVERRLMFGLEFQVNKKAAEEGLCSPSDLSDEQVYWENKGGVARCAAPIWREGTQSRTRYMKAMQAIANRYKDEPLMEYLTAKGEGALAVKNDATFTYDKALNYLMEIGQEVRRIAPKIPYVIGTNNYRVGQTPDSMETIVRPTMESMAGFGVRWPDTFAQPTWAAAPSTAHHKYYPEMTKKFMMAGELQLPGNRFETFDDVWKACCDASGYHDAKGDSSAFIPPTDNHTWGASHITVITTYEKQGYPVRDAIATWEANNWQMYFDHCPTEWVENGAVCVTGKTSTNPGIIIPGNTVPDPQPEPQPREYKFSVGERVKIRPAETVDVVVRDIDTGRVIGTQPPTAKGVILEDPRYLNMSLRWHVDFESGMDGWVIQYKLRTDNSSLTPEPIPDPIPVPDPTPNPEPRRENKPPKLYSIGDRQMNGGQHLTFFVNAHDLDGDTVTYSVSGLTSWMSFTGNRFTATPKAGNEGMYPLTFYASDGYLNDLQTITLTVGSENNQKPELHSIGHRQMRTGQHLTLFVNASDPNGDAITYSVSGLQPWMSFSGNRFTASPKAGDEGNYTLTFRASDGRLADVETITLAIQP